MESFDPLKNYEQTKIQIGYVERKNAKQEDYDRIGFMSGLEVHQQLLTEKKLFCQCPAGIYQKPDEYDAEIIRHMRPTLSELGEYDGTALMEFKTKKNIFYRLKKETACTYDIDDTPPFHINMQALEQAIIISHLSKLIIVGELHITRKQYLDGSIPAGFQRTAIVGVEGLIHLKNKDVRLIQLSIEEDSCREVSDIGHDRVYRTDRLGMPLIETVTYPDMTNPDEVKEACDYIRFLNRSTGLVRTGMGAGRQDVNVSCKGGTRVEIKGVAHTKWIPELTHNECFRQWALVNIKNILNAKSINPKNWKIDYKEIDFEMFSNEFFRNLDIKNNKIYAVNLKGFKGILSHFTQPTKCFANEISERLKVVACIEHPNMTNSEDLNPVIENAEFENIKKILQSENDDAQIVFWGPEDDIETALEVIEERCLMAFSCVPNETRKSFENGTTIFERVLPGADRMYPDTDSPPVPLADDYIDKLTENLPSEIIDKYKKLKTWNVPENYYTYIFKKNLFGLIEKIVNDLSIEPIFVCKIFAQHIKNIEGKNNKGKGFNYELIYDALKYLQLEKIELEIIQKFLKVIYLYPRMDYLSVLETIKFKRLDEDEILAKVPFIKAKFKQLKKDNTKNHMLNWVMGQLHPISLGNISLKKLSQTILKS